MYLFYYGRCGYVYQDKQYQYIHCIRLYSNKKDTFTVEGVNADLRHYIPVLARRSRCFPRSIETLKAVVEIFVDAYNQFSLKKFRYRQKRNTGELLFSLIDFI